MFFQRRRLQVLFSLLVIVLAIVYLGTALLESGNEKEPSSTNYQSQLFEAFYLLRNRYVHRLEEAPLLEGAVLALRKEAVSRKLDPKSLPEWTQVSRTPGDAELRRVQSYIERVATLQPELFSYEEAVYTALAGMTQTLADPYTLAMDPKTFARFQEGLHTQLIGGVGLEVEWTQGAYVLFEVLEGSPASLAGLKPGDRLLAIGGVKLFGPGLETEPLESVRFLLGGEIGTKVELRLEREGALFHRTLTRQAFETRSVHGRMLGEVGSEQPLVGWIRVESLGEATGHEMVQVAKELLLSGATGFVLDLRDNVGGYLNASVEIASTFLPSGQPVLFVQGRAGEKSQQTIGADPIELPMVVLVNERTASSAEILAGAFQDYGRAVVVGQRTFGKGSVQSVHDFPDGGGFKLTTATYLTPKKRLLEGKGLEPDHLIDVGQGRDEEAIQRDVLSIYDELWIAVKNSDQ